VGAGSWPGGWLADTFNLAAPFWANAALAAIVTLLAWFFVPETRDHGREAMTSATRPPSPPMLEQLRQLGTSPGFVLISIVSFAAFFARTGGLFNVIPLLAEDQIGLSPDQIGLGIGMISIVGLVLVYPSGALVDRFGRKAVIVPSTLLSAIAIVGFALAQTFPQFMIASTFWAASSGISGAAPAAYAADVAPRRMIANAMGMYRTLADSGYVLGPIVLGGISDLASPEAALVFTAILLLSAGSTFAFRAKETLPGRAVPPSSS